jgi:hypothetical protein
MHTQQVTVRRTVVKPQITAPKRKAGGLSTEALVKRYGGAMLDDWRSDFGSNVEHYVPRK